ncbi:hypothetical protein [Draconibacterium sediminis]|uniref:hypothetical protein n=1 Tax=Draconibacterium sediminis TaxID=1544798 RepID=UPI0026E9B804|nr:hypothetical protein [Draconibacterium sediminis]
MKATQYILILLILSTQEVNGQDTFVTKSHSQILREIEKGTDLEREVVSDSIQYEIRFWDCDVFIPGDIVIQFKKDFNNNWSYRPGFYKIDSTATFSFQDSIIKEIDWKQFEIKLDSFINAKVPNQNEIELKLIKDGQTYTVNEYFFSSIMDGGSSTIEIFDNNTHKAIHYNNPKSYLEKLIKRDWSTKEHENFIKFSDYITESFDATKLRRIQLKEIYENKDIKKSKRETKKNKKKKISS